MDRRRAAGLLLALAACIATATAAPTASNHTALDLYDAAPEGCYYNFQHYGEGDRIMTNEPCLNCTCHNRMLMCYLRVCPFTKPIGQDCTIEKRADQCCPIVTCPDVPVDLLTSTTTSPAEYGPTGIGKLDKFGCSINGKYFSEGSKVPPTPNKPCEHCYCIRNMTTCVMQECTLHVDGCTPIYHKDVCCPVRYSCDHPEDEMPLLDDLSTTVRPTPGFLLTTTTISPVTQMSQDCVYDNRVFSDGALIKTEKACDHCYCMKGDIVCVVQECGTPMENEGKNCTALQPREGVCCPDTYICEGDESTTETYDLTVHSDEDKLTTLTPPRRTSSEGSGYRNEPDEVPFTELPVFEPEIEGSGEEEEPKYPTEITTDRSKIVPGSTGEILVSTEETHEYIPLTTTKPTGEDKITAEVIKNESSTDSDKILESQTNIPSTTVVYSIKEHDESVTEKTDEDIGSGDLPQDIKPHDGITVMPGFTIIEENVLTTEPIKQDTVTSEVTEKESFVPEFSVTTLPIEDDITTKKTTEYYIATSDFDEKTTPKFPNEHELTSTASTSASEESMKSSEPTDSTTTKSSETPSLVTTSVSIDENKFKETTVSPESIITSMSDDFNQETQQNLSSTTSASFDDDYATTESQEHEVSTERAKETEYFVPQQHITASTPMLEEIEKDTTEYIDSERIVSSTVTQDDTFGISSTSESNDLFTEVFEKDVTKSTIVDENKPSDDRIPGTTNVPAYSHQETTTTMPIKIPEFSTETSVKEALEPEQYTPSSTSKEDSKQDYDFSSSTVSASFENGEITTEPDKGLNTIPSDIIEDVPVSSEVQKSTITDEKITTESDLYTKLSPSTDSRTTPSIVSTISDTSVSREEPSTLTTEAVFRKEDKQTEDYAGAELTTVPVGITKEVISTLTQDYTKTTESILELQYEIMTTSKPKYTEDIEETTSRDESTSAPIYELSTAASASDKDTGLEETMTSTPPHEKISETTTVNQEDNEIFNEPRIPGEGDCLLNGITYTNESTVPSTNKCQSGCKCISSIIKCDPIICSPPPEYMDNCETMYDTPNSCCPTYICDHKTETIPPQSHSQMSGTEAPVISTVHCKGDECEISEDKKHYEEPTETCKSGSCLGPSHDSNETISQQVPTDNITQNSISAQEEKCSGDKCTPILCSDENGCQASPVTPCEGENCETKLDVVSPSIPPKCLEGENCVVDTEECNAGNCGAVDTQSEKTHPLEACTEKEGCQNVPVAFEDECKEDNCRRKDSSLLDQKQPEPCADPNCKKIQPEIGTSTVSAIDKITKEDTKEEEKHTSIETMDTTEKMEKPTDISQQKYDETSETLGPNEFVTKQPALTPDETTISDDRAIISKFEPETEVTTKSSEFTYEQEVTGEEFITDENKLGSTGKPVYSSSTLSEPTVKDHESYIPYDVTTEMPDIFITQEHTINIVNGEIKTEQPQEITPMETSTPDVNNQEATSKLEGSSTEPSKAFTYETQRVTKPNEKVEPEHETHVVIQESSTELSQSYTSQPQHITKPLIEFEHEETSTQTGSEELATTQNIIKMPEVAGQITTTATLNQESNTEPSKMYVTESQKVTETEQQFDQKEVMAQVTEENTVTEPPMSVDSIKQEEFIKEIPDTSGTETTKFDDTQEQVDKLYQIETSSKPYEDIATETLATPIDLQSGMITSEDIEHDSSTIKTTENITQEPPKSISTESQDVTLPPEEVEIKDTPSTIADETVTKPIKTINADSLEISKPSDELDQEVTTVINLEKPSSEPSIPYVSGPIEITKSPQDLDEEDITEKIVEDNATEPPKLYSTESYFTTSTSEKTESNDSIVITSTESNYVTEEISTEELHQDVPTSEISDKDTTEPPRRYDSDQEITKSPEEIDRDYTTVIISEEPPTTFFTESQETPAEVDKKDTTTNISVEPGTESPNVLSTEPQEVTKTPGEIDREKTTVNALEEFVTKPPTSFDTKPQDAPKLPEEPSQDDTTSKITQATRPHAMEAEDLSTSSQVSVDTTTKMTTESVTEPSETQEGIKHQPVVESESPAQFVTESYEKIDTPKQTIDRITTEKPKEDIGKPSMDTETTETITTQAPSISKPVDLTTQPPVLDSKVTIPQEAMHKEITAAPTTDFESQSPESGVESATETSIKEQVSPILISIEHDTAITVTPGINDFEKVYEGSKQETQKPDLGRTTISPPVVITEVYQPNVQQTLSTELPIKTPEVEKDVLDPTDTIVKVPAFIPTDELKSTSSEIYDLTTSLPAEASEEPTAQETKTEYPEANTTPKEEHNIDVSTDESLVGTEKPFISEETKTETPATVTEMSFTKEVESQTLISPIITDGKPIIDQGENYTDEPLHKYSPIVEHDSTKVYPDEDISTKLPLIHESKEPQKDTDDLVHPLVTQQYETSTNPSDLEKDSETQKPIEVSPTTPESDNKQPSEQSDIKINLTTPSSKLPETTLSGEDKFVTSTEFIKPVNEDETRTESDVDIKAGGSTTQGENFFEENATTPNTLTSDHIEISTKSPGLIPSVDIATETESPATLFTLKQESAATDKLSVDMNEYVTESSHIDSSEEKVTKIPQIIYQGQEPTETGQEVTKVPDVLIPKQTEPSEVVSGETSPVPFGTETPMFEPVTEQQVPISVDQIKSEDSKLSEKQPELTTLNPNIYTDSSAFEPTTAQIEYTESISSTPEDTKLTDEIKEESVKTPTGEGSTTEITKLTEITPEVYTEKQPEVMQTKAPESETSIPDYLTTKKQFEPEVYQTTLSVIKDIPETSTPQPLSYEKESTTLVDDTSPADEHTPPMVEQSIPVVISNTEKTSSPEESIPAQTETVIPASEKPLQETMAPEEDFTATTVKAEEEISTISSTADRTMKPTDTPSELPIMTETPITTAPETIVTTGPEISITEVPEVPLITISEPEVTITTKAPAAPTTTVSEASITKSDEVPATVVPEVTVTKKPELPITNAAESPVTAPPELPKPVSTEVQSTDEAPTPDEEGSFPPTGGTSGYGQEPDYIEEDQTFGPGTCRYGGKVYVSAQQIPRDDPCDFCFCFRSDIICLQQSCPPPIHGCHEEPIQGFCCPRYECPVSMATTVNVTTTTTTTTTTLPPHFPTHSYKGSVQKRGCQIKGQTYKVGEVVRASSGPCLHCTCGGDGQMKCDPKVCTPEPMLRQMIAAAVSAKRRR